MSSPSTIGINIGDLRGTAYTFAEVGDTLPMHEHDPEQSHISIIARGSFKVFSGGSESTGTAGMVLDFPDNTPHEFIALEINSKLININKTVVR